MFPCRESETVSILEYRPMETILDVNHDATMEQRSEVETRDSPEVDQLHVTVGN
jgi:hypothetical protein